MRGNALARGSGRGQTAQDFAVGIGLFLLAVAFVFAFVPYVIGPYDAGAGAAEASQADRAATAVLGNVSDEARPNELDVGATNVYFDSLDDTEELRNRTGLPFTARVNVTVTEVDTADDEWVQPTASDPVWVGGNTYREQFGGASYTRIVRSGEPGLCEPACRLVVRVW